MESGARTTIGWTVCTMGLFFASCGGNQKAPETAPAPVEETANVDEDVSEEEAALLAQIEESAAIADEAAADAQGTSHATEGEDGPAEREVVYRVSQDSLKVQIEGAEFVPKAIAVRAPGGGWGVKLTVTATTDSNKLLWSTPAGPLAFGGRAIRGTREKITDTRGGGDDIQLAPGAPVEFDRTWPAAGEKGLSSGDELELHVGLWGFGSTPEDRRPVNRFLTITMRGGGKSPQPIVQPPR